MMRIPSPLFLVTAAGLSLPATAFSLLQQHHPPTSTSLTQLNAVGVFFGTSTGSTETVADMICEMLPDAEGPFDVDDGDSIVEQFQNYDALIVGTPTWNTGADTERSGTGWDELYYGSMADLQLQNKKVAVFGLGDSVSYTENYADAAGELHEVFARLGCQMGYGYVNQDGYLHEASKSILSDGSNKFCGLLLDMVNQEELTEERVQNWVAQLTEEGFLDASAAPSTKTTTAPEMTEAAPPVTEKAVQMAAESIDEIVAKLEQENAALRAALEDNSQMLEESIASHDTGFVPHANSVTGRTMWTSPDGRTCFFTEPATTTTTLSATKNVAP